MRPDQIHDHLDLLREFGIELADVVAADASTVKLAHHAGVGQFQLIYAPEMTVSALGRTGISPMKAVGRQLVLGERVTERSAEMLRASGVNYLDRAGNAYISFDGVHIDVRGRSAVLRPDEINTLRSRGGTNLMSPKRAQVIFAVLSWEHLLHAPLRELARASGVSIGQTQETLHLLIERGYLTNSKQFNADRREALLDDWVQAYPHGLGAKIRTLRLSGDINLPLDSGDPVLVSGESAVTEFIRPETLTLYSREDPRALIAERRWRRDEQSPTVFLRTQFWHDPAGEVAARHHAAPPLLVFVDLLASGDSRQREAAHEYRGSLDQF